MDSLENRSARKFVRISLADEFPKFVSDLGMELGKSVDEWHGPYSLEDISIDIDSDLIPRII